MKGEELIAQWLYESGVECIFGVVGIPVVRLSSACQSVGIRFYSFHNEQAASYAAASYGYLTGRPGVCLCVSGPGVVHSLAGVAHAQINKWPVQLQGGSHKSSDTYRGAFQEAIPTHTEMTAPFCKLTQSPQTQDQFKLCLHRGLLSCVSFPIGPCYIEVGEHLLAADVPSRTCALPFSTNVTDHRGCQSSYLPSISAMIPSLSSIHTVLALLTRSQRPLLIVGKGAAFDKSEAQQSAFLSQCPIPVLTSPMGKGMIPEDHPQCVNAARSQAQKETDCVIFLGARANWLFGYGDIFAKTTNIVHVDTDPVELAYQYQSEHITVATADTVMSSNATAVPVVGSIGAFLHSLATEMSETTSSLVYTSWIDKLYTSCNQNKKKVTKPLPAKLPYTSLPLLAEPQGVHMSYADVFSVLAPLIPREAVLVTEGANTMDKARLYLGSFAPRRRFDATTFAAMGPSFGAMVASSVVYGVNVPLVAVLGDSSAGFSFFEIETQCRYRLPVLVLVINNNGIYSGNRGAPNELENMGEHGSLATKISTTTLTPSTRFDTVALALGAHPMSCTVVDPGVLHTLVSKALECLCKDRLPIVFNVCIEPVAQTTRLDSTDAFFKKAAL